MTATPEKATTDAAPSAEVSVWAATASVGLTQALVGALQLATMAVVSRLLGSTGMGLYATFVATVTLLALLADPLGLRWVNTWAVRRGTAVRATLGRSAAYAGGVLAVGWVLVSLGGGRLLAALERLGFAEGWEKLAGLLPLVALALPAVLFNGYVAAVLLGLEDYRDFNRLAFIGAASLLAAVATLWVVRGAAEVRTVAALWLGSFALAALWGVLRLRGRRPPVSTAAPFSQVAATGFRAFAINLLGFLHLRADIYLIGFFLAAADVGLYAVAVTFAELLVRVPTLVGTVIYPKSAGESEAGEAAGELARLIGRLLRLLPPVAVAALAGFWLAGRWLLGALFGAEYTASFPAAFWLLPGVLLLSGCVLINHFLAGKGYPWVLHATAGASLAANLLLNVFWIPRYGIAGAAAASSVSYGLWFVLLLVHFHRCYLGASKT